MTYENISKDTHGFATNNDLDTGNVIEQTDHKEPDFPGENSGDFWRQNTGFCHLPMDVFPRAAANVLRRKGSPTFFRMGFIGWV